MIVDGGIMLCSGVIVPAVGSLGRIVTGQKSISVVVTAGIVMIVVFVTTVPAVEDRNDVVHGGQDRVKAVASGNGGSTRVQGGKH